MASLAEFVELLYGLSDSADQIVPDHVWREALRDFPAFIIYCLSNAQERPLRGVAARASDMSIRLHLMNEEDRDLLRDNNSGIRFAEQVRAVASRLKTHLRKNGPTSSAAFADILERLPRATKLTEEMIGDSEHRYDRDLYDQTDYINALSRILARQRQVGRSHNRHHELREPMAADYEWLSGKKASYSNADGLQGEFITFQRRLWRLIGVTPAERVLRGRGPSSKKSS